MNMLRQISSFYERYEQLGLKITFILVALQIVHLYWLTTFVVFDVPQLTVGIPPIVFVVIDYLEIPALISGMVFYLLYISKKNLLFVGLLGIQFLHIFWVTDTFVYMAFNFNQMVWLAWLAVFVDFLEVPVIFDLFRKLGYSLRQAKVPEDSNLT